MAEGAPPRGCSGTPSASPAQLQKPPLSRQGWGRRARKGPQCGPFSKAGRSPWVEVPVRAEGVPPPRQLNPKASPVPPRRGCSGTPSVCFAASSPLGLTPTKGSQKPPLCVSMGEVSRSDGGGPSALPARPAYGAKIFNFLNHFCAKNRGGSTISCTGLTFLQGSEKIFVKC